MHLREYLLVNAISPFFSFYARQLKGLLTPWMVPHSYTGTEGNKRRVVFCKQTVTTEPRHQTLLQPLGFRDRAAPTENDEGFRKLHDKGWKSRRTSTAPQKLLGPFWSPNQGFEWFCRGAFSVRTDRTSCHLNNH